MKRPNNTFVWFALNTLWYLVCVILFTWWTCAVIRAYAKRKTRLINIDDHPLFI